MSGEYYIESGAEPQKLIQFLEDKIYEHNSAKIEKDDGRLFCRVVRDQDNNIVAGRERRVYAEFRKENPAIQPFQKGISL